MLYVFRIEGDRYTLQSELNFGGILLEILGNTFENIVKLINSNCSVRESRY